MLLSFQAGWKFKPPARSVISGHRQIFQSNVTCVLSQRAVENHRTQITAMTLLLEPVMIIFLAVVVGSIVIAMFLPLIVIINDPGFGGGDGN